RQPAAGIFLEGMRGLFLMSKDTNSLNGTERSISDLENISASIDTAIPTGPVAPRPAEVCVESSKVAKSTSRPLKRHGGKRYLADWIISKMPPRAENTNAPAAHDSGWMYYVEP